MSRPGRALLDREGRIDLASDASAEAIRLEWAMKVRNVVPHPQAAASIAVMALLVAAACATGGGGGSRGAATTSGQPAAACPSPGTDPAQVVDANRPPQDPQVLQAVGAGLCLTEVLDRLGPAHRYVALGGVPVRVEGDGRPHLPDRHPGPPREDGLRALVEVGSSLQADDSGRASGGVARLAPWFHGIDLGQGVRTKDGSIADEPDDHPRPTFDLVARCLPADLAGQSVLDVGCNGGFYAVEMKRRERDGSWPSTRSGTTCGRPGSWPGPWGSTSRSSGSRCTTCLRRGWANSTSVSRSVSSTT